MSTCQPRPPLVTNGQNVTLPALQLTVTGSWMFSPWAPPVTNLKVGVTQATRAYLGTVIVWQYGAAQTWTGTPATITVTGLSGTWAQPQVWTRSTMYVVLEDGDTVVWYDEPVVEGIEASIIVVGISGTWAAAQNQTWTASAATVTVTATSGTWG